MKKVLLRILTELNFCFIIETLAQTGEEIAIANTIVAKFMDIYEMIYLFTSRILFTEANRSVKAQ